MAQTVRGDFRDAYSLRRLLSQFATQKYEVVTQGRNFASRRETFKPGKKVKFVLKPTREVLPHDAEVIKILLNAEAIEIKRRLRREERRRPRTRRSGNCSCHWRFD